MTARTTPSRPWTSRWALGRIGRPLRQAGTRDLALGGGIVGAIAFLGILAPFVCALSPYAQDLRHPFLGMSLGHPFGTDGLGRDIAVRVLYGARYSLLEALAAVSLACSVGSALGVAAGTVGGAVDRIVMGLSDILFAFPGVVLALLILSLLGPGLGDMLIAISIFSMPVYARLSRNLAMGLRRATYVEAAAALGAGRLRITLRHILPNILGPILVQASVSAGSVILTAASLSFLGLGVQPPTPEWGSMMSDGRNTVGAFILPSLFPGLAITLLVLGFNLLGEGLRSRLAPGGAS